MKCCFTQSNLGALSFSHHLLKDPGNVVLRRPSVAARPASAPSAVVTSLLFITVCALNVLIAFLGWQRRRL